MKKIALFLLFVIIATIAPLTLSAQNGVHNGHRYVDLGLPSGTKWADCNIGAKTRTGYGYYYAWGETSTKTRYTWSTYKFGNSYEEITKYVQDDFGLPDLDFADDVANKLWGGKWRIPSSEQLDELLEHTKHKWTRINGVDGWLFTGRNGHSIFLPAAGDREGSSLKHAGFEGSYWSRSLHGIGDFSAVNLWFNSRGMNIYDDAYCRSREMGFTVRPVYNKNTPIEDARLLQISGTDNGHNYVDLGLPSGTKWADCNIGASSITEYGNYYAWGETTTKSNYEWDTYKFCDDDFTKYCTVLEYIEGDEIVKSKFIDNKAELELIDDVAHELWGGQWRLPSEEQFKELIKYTENRKTKINGVNGWLFTGRNGHSIFLPAAGSHHREELSNEGSIGEYWSRTLCADTPTIAYGLFFNWDEVDLSWPGRANGNSVRPIHR